MSTINITIDTRERAKDFNFFDAVKEQTQKISSKINVTIARKQLEYGDFIVEGPDVVIIVERKVHNDLAVSLRNKHRDEQRATMDAVRQSYSKNKDQVKKVLVVWLLEGHIDKLWHTKQTANVPNTTLDACMDSFQFKDGVFVHWTSSPAHTANYIGTTCVRRVSRGSEVILVVYNILRFLFFVCIYILNIRKYVATQGLAATDSRGAMTNAVSGTKRKMLREADDGSFLYSCMLTVVPGVTPKVASLIQAIHPTMADLTLALKKTEEIVRIAELQHPEGKRKVGPALAKRLKTALLPGTRP